LPVGKHNLITSVKEHAGAGFDARGLQRGTFTTKGPENKNQRLANQKKGLDQKIGYWG